MRRTLDTLYDAAAYLAALFLVGTLVMVLLGIFGRLLSFQVRGTDAYAGYFMAGAGFLALAHTFARGEHIFATITRLRDRYIQGDAIPPSIRTMRRWFSQGRWLRPPVPALQP